MKQRTRNWILAAVLVLAATALLPPARTRGALLWGKMTGSSELPWPEIMVRMAPWSQQDRARSLLGFTAPQWSRRLDYGLDIGGQKRLSHQIFLGATPNLQLLDCHYTILRGGVSPHPPHQHAEEEILIPVSGQVDIVRLSSMDSDDQAVERVEPGLLVYHPPGQPHTIRAPGPGPSSYLILRWRGEPRANAGQLAAGNFDYREALESGLAVSQLRSNTLLFESPTRYLERLHVHVSTAEQGAGSEPHRDEHDVLVVVLKGVLAILGETLEAPAVSFHPAHKLHGFRGSPGGSPAQYLAIEFHRRAIR